MERSERRTYCRICPALCGLRIEIEGERIKRVRGDRQHPLTRGYFCRKGQALGAFHHHPRRLNAPTLGRPPQRRVTSWEESLDDLAVRLSRILDESGPDAIGFYFGTWAWLDALGWRTADAMLSRLGSRSRYSALTVDGVPRAMVGEMVAGNARLLPNIDRDETRMLLLVGTNPVIAHGHSSSWPRGAELLREVARRGEVWVADPRRTESARLATRHLPLRAGSDAFLLAGLLRSLLHEGGADHDYLADHAAGSERLAAAVAPFGLERVASATGLEPEAVAALAHSIRRHGRLAVATGTGVTMAREGLVTEWLAWALQIVTGSFDRPGGAWFNPGYLTRFDQRPLAPGPETPLPGPPSRPDLPSPRGERPCAALSDEIESGNLRALLVLGGNPVTSLPETPRLERALSRLEVLGVADVIASDTWALATHGLATTGQLERGDLTLYMDLFPEKMSAQYTPRVLAPGAERRPSWWIFSQLGRRLGLELPGAETPSAENELALLDEIAARSATPWPALRDDSPCVAIADPPRPRGWVLRGALAEGRWNLAPAPLIERLARLEVPPPLALIPRRSARRMNSALRDLAPTTGKLQDSEALVHPADALTAGVADGERVRVTSATGTLEATLRTSEEIARGAISIPHGLTAPNVGSLTTGRAGGVDSLSGMVIQSGIEVRLESARLPQRVVAFSPRSDRADAGSVTDSKHLIDGRTLTTRQGSTDPSREGR